MHGVKRLPVYDKMKMLGCHRPVAMPEGMSLIEGITTKECLSPVSLNILPEDQRIRYWSASNVRRARTRSGESRSRFNEFRSFKKDSRVPTDGGGGGGGGGGLTNRPFVRHAGQKARAAETEETPSLDGGRRWTRGKKNQYSTWNGAVDHGGNLASSENHWNRASAERDEEPDEDVWDAPPAGTANVGLEVMAAQTQKFEETKSGVGEKKMTGGAPSSSAVPPTNAWNARRKEAIASDAVMTAPGAVRSEMTSIRSPAWPVSRDAPAVTGGVKPNAWAKTDDRSDPWIGSNSASPLRRDAANAPLTAEMPTRALEESTGREWWYKDPHGRVQGPFAGLEMRGWHKSGFFKDSLPVACGQNHTFKPLGDLYTDKSHVFIFRPMIVPASSTESSSVPASPARAAWAATSTPSEDTRSLMNALNLGTANASQSNGPATVAAESGRGWNERDDSVAKIEAARAAEMAKVAANHSNASATTVYKSTSTLVKSAATSRQTTSRAAADTTTNVSSSARLGASPSPWGKAGAPAKKKHVGGGKSLLEIQAAEERERLKLESLRDAKRRAAEVEASERPAQSVWGRSSVRAKPVEAKSLMEIQAEEERREAERRKAEEREAAILGGRRKGQTMAQVLGSNSRSGLASWTNGASSSTASDTWVGTKPSSQTKKSLREVQADQLAERKRLELQRMAQRASSDAVRAGYVNAATRTKKMSLLEIQAEEEAARKRDAGAKRSNANAWARVAGGSNSGRVSSAGAEKAWSGPGTTSTIGDPGEKTDQSMFWNGVLDENGGTDTGRSASTTSLPVATSISRSGAPSTTHQAKGLTKPSDAGDNAFGGRKMPVDLMRWCQQELRKMSKNADETLMEFCYTLESSADIREYMRNYMGSTPQVSAFASEFIRRKSNPGRYKGNSGSTSKSSNAAGGQRRRRRRR